MGCSRESNHARQSRLKSQPYLSEVEKNNNNRRYVGLQRSTKAQSSANLNCDYLAQDAISTTGYPYPTKTSHRLSTEGKEKQRLPEYTRPPISFILRSRIILKTKCVPSFGCAKPCPRCRNRMSPSQMFLPLTRQLSVLHRWCNVPAGISTNQLPFVLCSHNNLFKSDLCH